MHLKLTFHDVEMNYKIHANNLKYQITNKKIQVKRAHGETETLYILVPLMEQCSYFFNQRSLHFNFALDPTD